jgi:hypothetical protein
MTIPLGRPLCSIPLSELDEPPTSGLLSDADGATYVSPALGPISGNEIDVSNLEVTVTPSDAYVRPEPATSNHETARPFLVGPPPAAPTGRYWPPDMSASYAPVLNDPAYALVNSKPGSAVRGVMVNTATLQTDIILV